MTTTFRPAAAADAQKIKDLIHRVHLNPTNLDWERFIVAEEEGKFVGCVQLKPHRDGAKELASLAVVPERQNAGIGSMLVRALLERHPGELYLMCRSVLAPYYRRFGFEEIGLEDMPRSFKILYRAARLFTALVPRERLSIMRRKEGAET